MSFYNCYDQFHRLREPLQADIAVLLGTGADDLESRYCPSPGDAFQVWDVFRRLLLQKQSLNSLALTVHILVSGTSRKRFVNVGPSLGQ